MDPSYIHTGLIEQKDYPGTGSIHRHRQNRKEKQQVFSNISQLLIETVN